MRKRPTRGPYKTRPLADRFWEKVKKTSKCWNWTGGLAAGYGRISIQGRRFRAPRVAWFLQHKSWPKNQIDHLCRNRACVRVSHLEDVVQKVNLLRGNGWAGRNAQKTLCLKGHPLSKSNLLLQTEPEGRIKRVCLTCRRVRSRVYYHQNKKLKGGGK